MTRVSEYSRRSFLGKAIATATGAGSAIATVSTIGAIPALTHLWLKENGPAVTRNETTDIATDQNNQGRDNNAQVVHPQYTIERHIGGTTYLLHGVEHTREYALTNFNELEQLVKSASIIVPEYASAPEYLDGYFATIADLCLKHGKPMADINVQTNLALKTEMGIGIIAGLSAQRVTSGLSDERLSRRAFATKAIAANALLYAWGSSIIAVPKLFIGNYTDQAQELIFPSHTIDHRNVHYADRLLRIPSLFPDVEMTGPVLFTSGRGHTAGIDFYLRHPSARAFKKMIYKGTWDRLGDHTITMHRPRHGVKNGTTCWETTQVSTQ